MRCWLVNPAKSERALVQFLLTDSDTMLFHNEPIWRNDKLVGYVTSGMYGHTLGAAVGLGYVKNENGVDDEYIQSGEFEIEVAGRRIPAHASLQPMYDPASERVRA